MRQGSRHITLLSRLLLIGGLVTLLATLSGSGLATAHGKELSLEVSSFAADPDDPLTRLYSVTVAYAGDLDPVTDANVRFTATRRGGGPTMDSVLLEPLNDPGLYAARVTFPMFGSWEVSLKVEEYGSGEASFLEELLPAGPARDSSEARQQVLQLFFGFDWRDVAAIAVRISHSFGAFAWYGLTAVVLAAFWLLPAASRPALFRNLSRFFPVLAALSLGALAISGVYTAAYSAPIKPPGVFDFDVMWRIPFGQAYLATIMFKVAAGLASIYVAFAMAKALRTASTPIFAGGSVAAAEFEAASFQREELDAAQKPLLRLAIVNAFLSLGLVVAVAVSIYLHYISHLAVLLPE
ncbi:MAG: FixH family protein [Chloroflexi bacterium]|nr:FixH family protein [Chloroflexota bacterium]